MQKLLENVLTVINSIIFYKINAEKDEISVFRKMSYQFDKLKYLCDWFYVHFLDFKIRTIH